MRKNEIKNQSLNEMIRNSKVYSDSQVMGAKIGLLREELGLTRQDLYFQMYEVLGRPKDRDETDPTRAYNLIKSYEEGIRVYKGEVKEVKIKTENLVALSEILDCDIDYLIERYEYTPKVATPTIQESTGLSELSISRLIFLKEHSDERNLIDRKFNSSSDYVSVDMLNTLLESNCFFNLLDSIGKYIYTADDKTTIEVRENGQDKIFGIDPKTFLRQFYLEEVMTDLDYLKDEVRRSKNDNR